MPIGRHSVVWFALLSAICASFAQSNIILFPITNAWRYEQSANLDGVNWQSPSFNDAGWPSGIGLLYVESNPSVTPRNTPLTLGRITYYFRTHFQCTNSMAGVGLVFSNLVDDGAVFYLNGREIRRIRMLLPPYQPVYASTATEWPPGTDATAYDVFSLSGDALTNVIYGDNLLAVEVHQQDPGSSDIVFGTALSIAPSTGAFTFTEQPTNMTVLDGRPFVLRAGVSGEPQPALQWFKNGSIVPGATLTTLSFPSAAPSDGGTYWVVASNISMVLTSNPATITVPADNIAPAVFLAAAQKNLTNIVIDFSEPVRPGATNLANYQVVKSGQFPTGLTVISATLSNQTNLLLTTTPRTPRVNYELRLTNIVDFSSASNQVSAAPIPLKYVTDLLRIHTNAIWRYEQSGVCPAAGWFASDFDDSAWPSGGPVFFASRIGGLPPAPIGTPLQLMNLFGTAQATSYFFRAEFELPGLSTNALSLRHIIDDGAALYLNGQPFYSIRLGFNGACEAFASGSVGTPNYEPLLSQSPFSINNSALSGANVFAAEVHQSSANNNDVAFAVSLEALIDDFVPGLSLTLPAFTTNGAGVLLNAGRVTLTESASTNVMVALNSSVSSALSVPANVTVLAGETNALFNITVGSNGSTTGPRRASVNASAGGFIGATKKTVVLDSVPAVLNLVLPGSIVEGSGTFTGRVEFVAPIAQDVTVTLTSTMPGAVGVPPYTIIAAGQTSAVFQLVIPNNTLLEGTRTSTVTAHVTGWVEGIAMVSVLDKPDSYRAISLTTRDLAYDPVTQRIYASVPGSVPAIGNQIVPIAQETGAIETGFSMGGEPGKLLVASAGGKLYASVETNRMVRRADLPSRTTELSFPLETNAPSNLVIEDFELLPGSPNPVAVLRLQNNFFSTVAIYDEGIRRTNIASGGDDAGQEIMEASADGSSIYVQNFAFQGFRRLGVDAQGTSAAYVDYSITAGQWTRDWKAVENRLFGGDGVVIDPLIPKIVATIPNIPVNSPMCYDGQRRRFFYLAQSNTVWFLRAFDSRTLAPLGGLQISGVNGNPTSLIRTIDDGFAFRTDANQVFVLRTTMTGSGGITDLKIALSSSSASIFAGGSVICTINITNLGPRTATNVILSALLPPIGTILTSSIPYSAYSAGTPGVSFSLGVLAAGMSTNVALTLRLDAAGLAAFSAAAVADAIDSDVSNNFASLTVVATLDPNRNGAGLMSFSAADIAYDALRHRLYASTTPDAVAVIDPDTGEIVNSLFIGPNPSRLAISGDAQYLYLAVSNKTAVARLNLITGARDLLFALGTGAVGDALVLDDLVVKPDAPRTLLVAAGGHSIFVFDDGVKRPQEFAVGLSGYLLEFGSSPDIVYGNGRPLQIFPNSIQSIFGSANLPVSEVEFAGGHFYGSLGGIFDPATAATVGNFAGLGSGSVLEPHLQSHRALFVTQLQQQWRLLAYDSIAQTLVSSTTLSNLLGNPLNLIRWGTNGIAFNTSGDQIFLFKGTPLPSSAATDLVLTQSAGANPVLVGSNASLTISISNAGPSAASGVVVAVRFDSLANFVDASGTQGGYTQTNNQIIWSVGSLLANASASFTYTIHPSYAGALASIASATSTAIENNHGNNVATNRFAVILGVQPQNSVGEVRVTTSGLAYDPVSGRLFATIPASSALDASSLLPLNPVTGASGTPIRLTAEPTKLGITEDGQFAYVSLYAESAVQRINLFNSLPELKVDFGEGGLAAVSDLAPVPGTPHSFVMINNEPPISGVPPFTVAFDDAVPRPNGVGNIGQFVVVRSNLLVGYNTLVPSSTYRVSITQTGLIVAGSATYLLNGKLKSSGGLIFADSGKIVNPDSLTLVTTLPVSGLHEPDAVNGHVFFLTLVSSVWTLRAFELATFAEIGSMPVPGIIGTPHSLIRCGTDRLAVGTSGGQVMLVRTSLAIVDADGDGLADNWEMAFFHSTNAPNGGAAQDFDGDGITNLQEYINGTDPTDASNAFRISGVSLGGGTAVFRFHGVTGIRYQLEQSPSVSGPWAATGPVVMGQGLGFFWTNALPPVSPQFYRLRQVP